MGNKDLETIKNEITPMSEIREKINSNIFDNSKQETITEDKNELVETMFQQAIVNEVANNEDLKNNVLDTAQKFTKTKMQTIKTNVETEFLEANFNNKKDACESYGFNEKTTPVWATRFMTFGYSIMLAIWLFIGTFTYMPIIFITKKLSVGIKKTWIAIVFAITLYLLVTLVPILLSIFKV